MRDKAARGQLCNSTINTNNKVLQTSCDKHIIKPVIVLPLDAIMLMFVSQDITDRFTVSHYCIRIQIEGEETASAAKQVYTQMVNTDMRKLYFCKSVTFDPKSEMEKEAKGEFWQKVFRPGGVSAVVLASCPYWFSIHTFSSHYPLKNNEEPVGLGWVQSHLLFPGGRYTFSSSHNPTYS